MSTGKFYRSLPCMYAMITIVETLVICVVGMLLLVASSNTSSTIYDTTSTTTVSTTTRLSPAAESRLSAGIAFVIINIMISFITAATLWAGLSCCCICLCIESARHPFIRTFSLNCNCPCYIPRPRWRFSVRLIFHIIRVIFRILALVLYGTAINESPTLRTNQLIIISLTIYAVALILPLLTILLDTYHYRVWWFYEPIVIADPSFTSGPLSPKHKRFIPYVLIERFRTAALGNQKCKNGSQCQERELEHIVIFHSADFRPQPRWSSEYPIYIGFHQTQADYAMSIAHSDMRISDKPPQMLGFGIYFARSVEHTAGKSRATGAFICAEIRMGKVLMITRSEVGRVRNSNNWWSDYDTVYLKHEQEERDEFCVKSPDQVLKWIIYVGDGDDLKLNLYGMDTEYNDTEFGCI